MRFNLIISIVLLLPFSLIAQPQVPVEQWTGKTIMHIGAHSDDDAGSHGTYAMLHDHGNQVYIVILTTGNVGTQDTKLSTTDLARIRKQEEIDALAELGIPADHYINLGYDDGTLEFADNQEVVEKLVRLIRKIHPDVLFMFEPGKGSVRWHKSDHRAACVHSCDAARIAMWPLLFQSQIINDGLQAHEVREYMLYDTPEELANTWVDISGFVDKKINAAVKYVSQYSSGWKDYKGPKMPAEEEQQMRDRMTKRMRTKDGKPVERFRYYKGSPEGIGR